MVNQSLPPLDDEVRAAHGREHVERPAGIKGGFRLSLTSGQWWWSPGVYRLHGYRQGQWAAVRPDGRMLLIHRHPDDRAAFAQAWRHLLADGGMIALRYRIMGVDGLIRPVFAMAYLDGPDGRPREVTGVLQSDGDARAYSRQSSGHLLLD
ncbi:MAG TPA: PAS domain-containing protein [Nakamurella sp.]